MRATALSNSSLAHRHSVLLLLAVGHSLARFRGSCGSTRRLKPSRRTRWTSTRVASDRHRGHRVEQLPQVCAHSPAGAATFSPSLSRCLSNPDASAGHQSTEVPVRPAAARRPYGCVVAVRTLDRLLLLLTVRVFLLQRHGGTTCQHHYHRPAGRCSARSHGPCRRAEAACLGVSRSPRDSPVSWQHDMPEDHGFMRCRLLES